MITGSTDLDQIELRLSAKWQGHRDARLILSRYGTHIDAEHEQRELAKLKAATGQK